MKGLVTYYVLFFIHVASRKVHVTGLTPYPDEQWMIQIARNVTMADVGFLSPGHDLIHDRDGKYCTAFVDTIGAVGIKTVKLPPRSPNLNPHAERWVRSVKEECLSRLILFGEVRRSHTSRPASLFPLAPEAALMTMVGVGEGRLSPHL